MGYIKFDTSDDLVHAKDFGQMMAYCHYLLRKYRPIDISLEMFARSPRDVPKASLPRYVIVVDIIMEGLDKPFRRELTGYTHHSFTLGMKRSIEEACHRVKMLHISLGDPTPPRPSP